MSVARSTLIATTAVPVRVRLAELLAYRELVAGLALRDFRVKHKRSVLGAFWSFLNPLFMMLIYTTVFNVILRLFTIPQYWAFILAGLLPWIFFASALTAATTSFPRSSARSRQARAA